MPIAPEEVFQRQLTACMDCLERCKELAPQVAGAAKALADSLSAGGKVLICGNGGSAAESAHFATELLCRLKEDRPSLAAISLCSDGPFLTATGNDYGFDEVFARQVRGLGRAGDVLVVLSTSGASANVRLALEAAREREMRAVTMLGRGGGACAGLGDVEIIVPSQSTARIQEAHLLIIHTICSLVEHQLFQLETIV